MIDAYLRRLTNWNVLSADKKWIGKSSMVCEQSAHALLVLRLYRSQLFISSVFQCTVQKHGNKQTEKNESILSAHERRDLIE